jgi:hypothetical protein
VLPYLARGHLGQRDFTNDEPRIIEVLRALLSALEYAHTRGIVHRDVKAENVLFDNADRPLLTDFGIALKRNDTSRITTAGLAIGSGGYMAPEQARGEVVDGRADLYSVGVLAYELLTGRLPYSSSDPLGLALMHAQDPIPRLPVHLKHWQLFLDRSMAKSPDNRFRNAQQMLGMLNQVSAKERPAVAEPEAGAGRRASTPLMSQPWAKPALVSVLAAALLLTVALLLRPGQARAGGAGHRFLHRPRTRRGAGAGPGSGREPGPAPAGGGPRQPEVAAVAAMADASRPEMRRGDPASGSRQCASGRCHVPTPRWRLRRSCPRCRPTIAAAAGRGVARRRRRESVTVNPLSFDPTTPGRAASCARPSTRIAQRPAQHEPPGWINAVDSLLGRAQRPGVAAPAFDTAAAKVFSGFASTSIRQFPQGATSSPPRAPTSARLPSPPGASSCARRAWLKFREGLPPLLERATEQGDRCRRRRPGLALARSLARTMDLDPKLLEPAWSRRSGAASRAARRGPGTRGRAGRARPSNGHPGVAFMREEVSRADYASFASRSGRRSPKCKQPHGADQPEEAQLGLARLRAVGRAPGRSASATRTRAPTRLAQRAHRAKPSACPTAAEFKRISSYTGSGSACQDGRVSCGGEGTVPTGQGPSSPLGLLGVKGNAREWLADCAGGCKQHLVGGVGWRDSANRTQPNRTDGMNADVGFDDVGFRLVREVPAH